jgi:5'-nucleotidase
MKKIKRILLTGDDGYNALGTRLLIHFLKEKYDLFVAGTKGQQSGVGGHLSIKNGGIWEETTIDGIPAFLVDGFPCDAMECLGGRPEMKFDLIISGINWGANIGAAIVSSGTYSAAVRALNLHLAESAIVMSWDKKNILRNHDSKDDLSPFLEYPGQIAYKIFTKAIESDLWGAKLLNINFPANSSKKVIFTKPNPDLTSYYNYPFELDRQNMRFSYPHLDVQKYTAKFPELDTGAILNGLISISLNNTSTFNEGLFDKIENKQFEL